MKLARSIVPPPLLAVLLASSSTRWPTAGPFGTSALSHPEYFAGDGRDGGRVDLRGGFGERKPGTVYDTDHPLVEFDVLVTGAPLK